MQNLGTLLRSQDFVYIYLMGWLPLSVAMILARSHQTPGTGCPSSPGSLSHAGDRRPVSWSSSITFPPACRCSSLLRRRFSVNANQVVIQQAVSHGPHHDLLLGLDPQLVLYPIDGVTNGSHVDAQGFRYPGIRLPCGELREDLAAPSPSAPSDRASDEPHCAAT